mgnify:CR=1 FL=1
MGASNQSAERKRWYSLGARGGVMEGDPVFKQVVSVVPIPQPTPDKYEFRNDKHILIWTDITGTLEAIDVQEKKITWKGKSKTSKRLYLVMSDEEGNFNVDLGDVGGRYAMNFMTRMLNTDIDLSKEFRMSPYRIENDDGTFVAGVVVYQQGSKIAGMNKEALTERGCPEADFSGSTPDFMPPARWLFMAIKDRLMSVFVDSAPEPEPEPTPESAPAPEEPQDKKKEAEALYGEPKKKEEKSFDEDDDLPF